MNGMRWMAALLIGSLLLFGARRRTRPGVLVQRFGRFGSGIGTGRCVRQRDRAGRRTVCDGGRGGKDRAHRPRTRVRSTVFASGLPPQVIPLGGVMDVAFIDDTAYALVTARGRGCRRQ